MKTPERHVLICDLDNTLYDWVDYFVASFYAMVDEVVKITGCDREKLLDDFRAVHRKHGDSEHPFALLETQTIQDLYRGRPRTEIARELDAAFHAFNSSRKENLRLYPTVRSTLEALTASNVILVAHTESKLYGAVDRLSRLDLTKYFRRVYCRERPNTLHPNPEVGSNWLAKFPMNKAIELSHHQRKPDPDVLLEICRDEGVQPESVAYVGDSFARDILMAKSAGVYSVWAKFGAAHEKEKYNRLVRVTHWNDDDVIRERTLAKRAEQIEPDFVLYERFEEILPVFAQPQDRVAIRA